MNSGDERKITNTLRREIKKYNIASFTLTRGTGSVHSQHERRCLWEICGKSMIQRVLETVLASRYINKVVLSSEDEKILEVGRKIDGVTIIPRQMHTVFNVPRNYGSGVYQRERPRSLNSSEPLIYTDYRLYCHWYLKEYESYVTDIEIEAPANEPMGTTKSVDKLIEAFFLDEEAKGGHTFYPVMPYIYMINPITKRPFPLIKDLGLDRQKYPPLYRSGPFSILGNPLKTTYDGPKLAHIIISPEEGLDVHDEEDLYLANCFMKRRLAKQKQSKGGDGT